MSTARPGRGRTSPAGCLPAAREAARLFVVAADFHVAPAPAPGCGRFGAQGGDWGATVATRIAMAAPERTAGIHLNICPVPTARARAGPRSGRTSASFWRPVSDGPTPPVPTRICSARHRSPRPTRSTTRRSGWPPGWSKAPGVERYHGRPGPSPRRDHALLGDRDHRVVDAPVPGSGGTPSQARTRPASRGTGGVRAVPGRDPGHSSTCLGGTRLRCTAVVRDGPRRAFCSMGGARSAGRRDPGILPGGAAGLV